MSKKRHTHPADSQALKRAVREIPSLIFEEVRKNELSSSSIEISKSASQKPLESAKGHATSSIYHSPAHSKRWMLVGVIATSIFIFTFWLLYISELIHENRPTLNPTTSLTNSSNKDLPMIISTFSKMEDDLKGKLKKPSELKAMISDALMPLFAVSHTSASTTATSTSDVIPTTTPKP